jgi:hypothetical protein
MQCQQLPQILQREENKTVSEEALFDTLAMHILSCPVCSQGIDRLSNALLTVDVLTCDTSRLRFPAYYEATHPPCLSGKLSHKEITEVAIHLRQCASCAEEYQVLVELWDED